MADNQPEHEQQEQLINEHTRGDFAKLYQVKGSQCLVTWNEDKSGGWYVSMEFRVYGVRTEAKFQFETLEQCLVFWDGITRKGAQAAYENVKQEFSTRRN